ncbi:response regulator [Steroidobacter sp.]|uniref:response regulator n=1 Tax=Steroidobacter sp. TaxID=1978227 RepID=UPI001A5F0B2E|nr:response regulator [Steroidobacter sp.]MBL8269909.1 response regulator [Steroidobacter sp.]
MQTVLVVDDEFGVAEVLQSILEDEGYRVATAINGKQALARLTELTPDLIMLDYMMPILDGTQTLAAIRKHPTLARVPVIMMSSLEEAAVRETCTDYNSFMRKPFRAAAVLKTVAQLLGPVDRE